MARNVLLALNTAAKWVGKQGRAGQRTARCCRVMTCDRLHVFTATFSSVAVAAPYRIVIVPPTDNQQQLVRVGILLQDGGALVMEGRLVCGRAVCMTARAEPRPASLHQGKSSRIPRARQEGASHHHYHYHHHYHHLPRLMLPPSTLQTCRIHKHDRHWLGCVISQAMPPCR